MLFLILNFLVFWAKGRLALSSQECLTYINKLYNLVSFTQESEVEENKINIVFGYNDTLFNNATFWGLTPQDGKEQDTTCLDLKISQFKDNIFTQLFPFKNQILSYRFNATTQMRYIILSLDDWHLVRLQSANQYKYVAFFGLYYQEAESNQVIKAYFLEFSIIINRPIVSSLQTIFLPLPNLTFCNDATCSKSYRQKPVVFGKTIFFKQNYADVRYKYVFTKVYLIGKDLKKEISPSKINYTVTGQVIFEIIFDIVWNVCDIQVETFLSNKPINSTYFVYENKVNDKLNIGCIMLNSSAGCPTCSDQCLINKGKAESVCPLCI